LKRQSLQAADLFEEGNSVVVAAHEQVLPVVDDVAGRRVDERIGAAAEVTPPLEQQNLESRFRKPNSG
jgi:hypothetical protein